MGMPNENVHEKETSRKRDHRIYGLLLDMEDVVQRANQKSVAHVPTVLGSSGGEA